MTVEIYADIACPWCYVAMSRFKRALRALPAHRDVDVALRPYQLEPALSRDPADAAIATPIYEERYGAQGYHDGMRIVIDAAATEGLEYHPENVVLTNTFAAHRLLWWVAQDGDRDRLLALEDALFVAYHRDGKTISEPTVLVEAAASVGIDAAAARAFVAGDEGAAEVTAALARPAELGVTEVPTFILDGKRRSAGAQSTATYLEMLESAGVADGATCGVPEA